ncbi:MAG: thermonuclease family protein [Nannocystaceae bacterium]|nr:thermonuclease family protein [Myxococcales bacterium]
MQREARFFWALIIVLLGASAFFSFGAEQRRREAQRGNTVALEAGELVTLVHVIDGDEVKLEKADKSQVVVRLLGIKAFEPRRDPFGDQGVRALEARLKDHPIRALPQRGPDGQAKFDSKERVIAELLVGDQNIGLSLVHDGLALVYTPYTFDTISTYLEQQGRARDAGRGVWGDAEGIKRADALIAQWARSREEGG